LLENPHDDYPLAHGASEYREEVIIYLNNMKLSKKLIQKIEQLDFKGSDNEFNEKIKSVVLKAVSENKPLNFISFTCSTINAQYLFSSTPWLYVRTNPKNNNLTTDIIRLQDVVRKLKTIYPRIQLQIIIGNTDPYYIYLQQFRNFSGREDFLWKKFIKRWNTYQRNFDQWVNISAPDINAQIINWYQFEKNIETRTGKSFENEFELFKKNIYYYFNQNQLNWELRKIKTQFGENTYFGSLKKPNISVLKGWIVRKFTEYAVQANWIYENIENPILIQNEKPSDLRSQMYQPAIRDKYNDSLPVVYFLGVDNIGYQ